MLTAAAYMFLLHYKYFWNEKKTSAGMDIRIKC